MRWRKWLAEQLELPPLELMDGFWCSPRDKSPSGLALTISVASSTIERATYEWSPKEEGEDVSMRPHERLLRAFDFPAISWDCLKFDPIHELLFHSDCEGEIGWQKCEALAERLEAIAEEAEDDTEAGQPARGTYDGMVPATRRFAAGLRAAFAAQENVDFH